MQRQAAPVRLVHAILRQKLKKCHTVVKLKLEEIKKKKTEKELGEDGTDYGGGGIVIGVVAGGNVVDGGGGGSGFDGVEYVERALDEGRGRVEIVVLRGNPSTHFRKMKLKKRLLMELAIRPKSMGWAWWRRRRWFLNVSLQKKGLDERESMVEEIEREKRKMLTAIQRERERERE